jgi:uncharacterized membrane protein YcaP (DUF421 family)
MHRIELIGMGAIAAIPALAIFGLLGPTGEHSSNRDEVEIILRVSIVYIILTLAFRVLGKRELSQLSPFELVTLLLIAQVVAPSLTAGNETLSGAMVGTATLLCLAFLHSILSYTSPWFRSVAEAAPTLLVRQGRILEDAIHRERVRPDEIYSELHKAGIADISQVKWGFLEPDGKMSFVRFDGEQTQSQDERPPL